MQVREFVAPRPGAGEEPNTPPAGNLTRGTHNCRGLSVSEVWAHSELECFEAFK